ncbi:photosystem reaction center subunit H [Methylobacterium currus]|uniref:Photosystem reaction center subunit H n=1 Tax=Methylobacterium currus TaxID=2051553 RepID=A0A2R4WFS8_9HYPH|nr:PRC-barrel domain-containing protein [Methylobacterium currus]AWB20395.1 photosystem reaction center subunit H [Methylobacterium currus]UHC14849.1 PRC-barrel domain-containing protein [Methylobacterium currus]
MSRPLLAAAFLLVAGTSAGLAQDAGGPKNGLTPVPGAPATLANDLRPTFVAQEPSDLVASKLIGQSIQNGANETIGSVADIVLGPDLAVKSYVVGVGGFLGLGTKYVSVAKEALQVTRVDDKTLKAVINTDKDQLRAAPEYVYLGQQADKAKADAQKTDAPKTDVPAATGTTTTQPAQQ